MTFDLRTDVLIIGGGPAGSTAALRLAERGIRSTIVERETFPRFHIGEGMTGEGGALVRELGFGDQMAADGHQVKQGVRVFGAKGRPDWWVPVMRRSMDGSLTEQFTWSVRRSVFDSMLLDAATGTECGADLIGGRATNPIVEDGVVVGCEVDVDGRTIRVGADITLDCSGQASLLANRGATGPKYLGSYDKQIALFSQVADYVRDDDHDREHCQGNTHIFYKQKYHWAWAIPIDDEITSVGIVVPAAYFRATGESKADFICREIRELNAGLAARIPEPVLVDDAHVIPNYSFQVRRFAGPGYICVGDAHRFVDPIFSFGLYVAMKEAFLVADPVERWLAGDGRDSAEPFHDHMVTAEAAIDVLEDLIDTFWENPVAFSVFVHDRFRDAVLDAFAGRIYPGMPTKGLDVALRAFRSLLGRDRSYPDDGSYSIPVGSRYQPERAPLWNSQLSSIETTEAWLSDLDAAAP